MQLTDKDGNIFGTGGLEITTSSGKPKVPVINTDITIGTTAIVGGVAGRLLYDNAGVVGETGGINWNPVSSTLSLLDSPFYSQAGNSSANTGFSITGTAGLNYTIYSSRQFIFNTGQSMYFNTDIDGGSALDRAWYFAGARSGITGGRTYGALTVDSSGFPSFTLYNNDNGARILLASNTASYFNGGNLLVGTTTDAGFKLDVAGTGRFSNTLTIQTTATGGSPSNSILISTNDAGNGGRISWGDSNTSILRYSNSLYFREYTGNFVFESTSANAIYFSIRPWGTTLSAGPFTTNSSITAASAIARGAYFNNTLVAAANNDVLVGLDVQPTFTNGAFTGVANYNLRTRGLTTKQYFQSPTTNQGNHSISFGFGGAGEQVRLIASAAGAVGRGNLYIASASGDTAVATISDANALFAFAGNSFYKSFTIDQVSLTTGQGLYISGNQPASITNGIFFRYSETRVAILSKPHGANGYADFRIAIVPVGGANNPPQESDTKFMITKDTTNVLVNTTTDAGFKFDVNGTARINNIFYVTNPSYTGNIRIEAIANTQQRIVGANGENITWGPDNAIRINSGETYVSGSFLGSGWWMQSNGATVLGAQAAAAASALLDIRSTTRGFLPPRMTNAQMLAISTPATGLMVYDTTNNKLCCYDGTTWQNLF